jgi:YYY domain-containing protein
MLTPAQWQKDQLGPTMDQMLPPDGIAMKLPVLFWWLAVELLGILAFPFAFLMLRGLADRGWVVAKTLGVIVLAYLTWITAATGLALFDRTALYISLFLFAACAAAVAVLIRAEIYRFIRANWRRMLVAELVFLAGFALFVWLRAWYPDLGHQFSPVSPTNPGDGRMGEKQMELAFLNAIVRSRVFPPLDPFFAHGYINYYYFGFVIVATVCKLTQITTATGFNLAIATFFAMLVANVFSVVLTLTRRIWPGVLATIMVGVFGNLAGGWQVVGDVMNVATVHSSFPFFGGLMDLFSGLRAVVVDHTQLPAYDFWQPTRIVPPVGGGITEFPYFTFLFADLHPHLMAYPMTAAVLCFAVSMAVADYHSLWRRAVAWGFGSLLFGAVLATNPWDVPTYLFVFGLGALVGAYVVRRRLQPGILVRPIGWCAALAAGAYVLYFPFQHNYKTVFQTGIGFTRDLVDPMCGTGKACTGDAYNALVTPLGVYLQHFGLFIFLLLSLLVLLMERGEVGIRARRLLTTIQFVYYYRDRMAHVRRASRVVRRIRPRSRVPVDPALVAGFLVLCAGLLLFHFYLLAFLAGMIGLVVTVLERLMWRLPPRTLFALALSLIPLGLSFLTQILYVKDFLDGGNDFRMNTIFKFYNQAWVMFAVVGGVAFWWVVTKLMPVPRQVPVPETEPAHGTIVLGENAGRSPLAVAEQFIDRHLLWSLALAILVLGSLVYTYAGTVARETYRAAWLPENSVPLTLDGMAFMKVAYPGDYVGISWLNAHVTGAPVIAEAADGYYQWPSRVSMFTGLPDIINGNHQPEQRYGDEIDPTGLCGSAPHPAACNGQAHSRDDDLKRLYSSTSTADKESVIRAYDVRYIYVGFSERLQFPAAGLRTFQGMVGHGLQVAFRHGTTVIYRVTHV